MKHASHGFFVSPPNLMILPCLVPLGERYLSTLAMSSMGLLLFLRVSSSPRSQCHHQLIFLTRLGYLGRFLLNSGAGRHLHEETSSRSFTWRFDERHSVSSFFYQINFDFSLTVLKNCSRRFFFSF